MSKMSIESLRRGDSGRAGANNPLARGEQSDPRTAENALRNQSYIQFIGRKRFTLSALSSGEVFQRRGEMRVGYMFSSSLCYT